MKVTLLELTLANACREQKLLFSDTFGYSAEINEENLVKAYNAGLHISFYVCHLNTFYNKKRRRAVSDLLRKHEREVWEAEREAREARYAEFTALAEAERAQAALEEQN